MRWFYHSYVHASPLYVVDVAVALVSTNEGCTRIVTNTMMCQDHGCVRYVHWSFGDLVTRVVDWLYRTYLSGKSNNSGSILPNLWMFPVHYHNENNDRAMRSTRFPCLIR